MVLIRVIDANTGRQIKAYALTVRQPTNHTVTHRGYSTQTVYVDPSLPQVTVSLVPRFRNL